MPVGAAYRVGDVTYLPAESLLQALGATTVWNAAGRRLTIRWEDKLAALSAFSDYALVNGQVVPLGATPRFLAGRLFVPLAFFERAWPQLTGRPVTFAELSTAPPPLIESQLVTDLAGERHHLLSLHKIVLDAGHGGHDPGARSPAGHREKDVNLALVRQLADRFTRETDAAIILSRRDDTFIPLPERTNTANREGADLFISIHANGAYSHTATGFEVYFLSLKSSDDRAARLAALENGAEIADGAAPPSAASGGDLEAILGDMIRTENLTASERLAVALQARLDLAMRIDNRGVKQAPFFVLAGAQMPAVLIEVGFMSNPQEAALLFRPDVQKRIVDALFAAILYYDAYRAAAQ